MPFSGSSWLSSLAVWCPRAVSPPIKSQKPGGGGGGAEGTHEIIIILLFNVVKYIWYLSTYANNFTIKGIKGTHTHLWPHSSRLSLADIFARIKFNPIRIGLDGNQSNVENFWKQNQLHLRVRIFCLCLALASALHQHFGFCWAQLMLNLSIAAI